MGLKSLSSVEVKEGLYLHWPLSNFLVSFR